MHVILDLLKEIKHDLDAINAPKLLGFIFFWPPGLFNVLWLLKLWFHSPHFPLCCPWAWGRKCGKNTQVYNVPKWPGGSLRSQAAVSVYGRFPKRPDSNWCLVDPPHLKHVFRNRLHTHSFNIQVVYDSTTLITNGMAKYWGSVHNAIISELAAFSRKWGMKVIALCNVSSNCFHYIFFCNILCFNVYIITSLSQY